MTVEEAVAQGASAFEYAETKARKIKAEMRGLRDVFKTIRDAGLIGGLEAEALAGRCDALATQFEANLYSLHSDLTKRCQELGIDLPSPPSGEIGTMGDGGR